MSSDHHYEIIDRIHREFAVQYSADQEHWLLIQTLYTTHGRRAFIDRLELSPNLNVLDIGVGFGAFAFDLAAIHPLNITAVDTDKLTLQTAIRMQEQISNAGGFHPDSHLVQEHADVYQLPYENNTFDLVIARLVFQHLSKPVDAAKEVYRVLKPGGQFIIVDIDDQYVITYPPLSHAFDQLQKALALLQSKKGGDRYIGRKLPSFMDRAGFTSINIDIRPQALYSFVKEDDISLQFSLLRFARIRDEIISSNIMTDLEFDRLFAQLKSEWGICQASANAEFYVSATK